ncbi:MAG: hypothetical protein KAR20_17090, partial [Candidatus Heimdallarchaeota archaeon]|nr:hypothetical protein [Candidatus Heimdallarchaeota archaeon]
MKNNLLKTISFFVCVIFSATTICQSAPSLPIVANVGNAFSTDTIFTTIKIPFELGHITEKYVGRTNECVVLIQDAHTSCEAQINIKNILHELTSQGISLITVEGANTKAKPELFRLFSNQEVNRKALEYLLKEGKLTGVELFSIESEKTEVEVYGVEKQADYVRNLNDFKTVHKGYNNIKVAFKEMIGKIEAMAEKVLNKDLFVFYQAQQKYNNNEIDVFQYL